MVQASVSYRQCLEPIGSIRRDEKDPFAPVANKKSKIDPTAEGHFVGTSFRLDIIDVSDDTDVYLHGLGDVVRVPLRCT